MHGGVDVLLFMSNAVTTTQQLVFQYFTEAVLSYGLPSRVRSDRGGENVNVANFMLQHPERGPGRGSFITGRSVHNSRIKRLWHDVFQGCLLLFYNIFQYLEHLGILVENEVHLFCLHYVYLPKINLSLKSFQQAWNCHPMQSEGGYHQSSCGHGFKGRAHP